MLLTIISSYIFSATTSDTAIVKLSDYDSKIVQDVKYATTRNFTGKKLYDCNKVYVRKIVAIQLAKINSYLYSNYKYRLKIFDGYRPLSIQKKMWSVCPNTDYVANPKKGSKHNRGAAVDVTIVDQNGNELDLGTPFDDFSKKASAYYKNFPPQIIKNRHILQTAMTKFNFKVMSSEWWHFDYKEWEKFGILDIKTK